ncbi:unnamed protein product [Microthlaspi erraticum]|uniref:Uncharacterized protein n=1 Tax=Microthlaspi erraticum TaxID=1685480 RepID=A0A6D2IQN6_9BRAS|nr:unnamed protein product [Microthlaspi erraticum]
MTKSKEGAFELIENLAASSSNKNAEYDRTVSTVSVKGSSADAKKIEELTAKSLEERGRDDQMEVNYVNGQPFVPNRGFNSNYRNHPNMSYRSTNVENPQDQVYPPRSNQNQQSYQKSYPNSFQEKTFAPNQNRSQGGNQQKAQFSNQQQPSGSSNNSNDELKVRSCVDSREEAGCPSAQTAEAVKRPHGTLPGKGEQNPRNEYVAQVELRSGRKLQPAVIPLKRAGKEKADENRKKKLNCRDCSSRAYAPKVPYPVPRKKSRKDLEDASCRGVQRCAAEQGDQEEERSRKICLVSADRPHDLRMLSLRSRLERELMPYSVAKRLGYTSSNPRKSLAGAIIDVKGGIIDLHLGDIVMRFEMNKLLKKPMLDGQTYVIEDGSNLVDEVSEEMLLDDPLEVALTKAEGEYDFLNEEADGFGK